LIKLKVCFAEVTISNIVEKSKRDFGIVFLADILQNESKFLFWCDNILKHYV